MIEKLLKWLKREWWGLIVAYFIVLVFIWGAIWYLVEPLNIPDNIAEIPEIMKRRAFYHFFTALLLAPYFILILELFVRQQNNTIKAEEIVEKKSVLNTELFIALQNIQTRIESGILHGLSSLEFKTLQKESVPARLSEMLNSKNYKELHIICYSLISSKSSERDFENFLNNGGKLHVLMLNPESLGFEEKTVLESFRNKTASAIVKEDIDEWKKRAENTQKNHQEHIQSSITLLRGWETTYTRRVAFRLYSDTPNFRIFMFDRKTILLSSYFYDPTSSGHDNPHLLITGQGVNVISQIINNWFDVKFSTGQHV